MPRGSTPGQQPAASKVPGFTDRAWNLTRRRRSELAVQVELLEVGMLLERFFTKVTGS